MKKKFMAVASAAVLSLALVGCSTAPEEAAESDGAQQSAEMTSVTVSAVNGTNEYIDMEVPYDPQSVAVLSYASADILVSLGLEDRITGMIKDSVPEHLQYLADDESIVDLGGMKEIDMEAMAALAPDVIFSSDRTAGNYDDYVVIAPTVASFVDYDNGLTFFEAWQANVDTHATIFGMEEEVKAVSDAYSERIDAIAEVADGQTCLLTLFTGGNINALGNEGRIGIIATDMGFENLNADENVNHGDEFTYEALLEINPEWVFVIDKDAAVGDEATLAQDLMDNPVVEQSTAFQNDQIVYLDNGPAWYLCDGGIEAMDLMIASVEKAVL